MSAARERESPPSSADVTTPRLVVFISGSSGRSRRVEGFLAQVLQRRRNHDTFAITRVDVDQRPDLADRFHVTSVPTLMVVDEGHVQARLVDPDGCRPISEGLSPWLK